METLQIVLFALQVLVALGLILLILIQHGKGADAGAAFGSGASATVFGAQGSGNFLTRLTTALAVIFLANSLGLAYLAKVRLEQTRALNLDIGTTAVTEKADAVPDIPVQVPAEPAADEALPSIPEEQ